MNLERGFYWWVFLLLCITDSLRVNKRTRPCDKYCLSFYTVRGLYGFIPNNTKDSKLLPLSCSFLKCNWNAIITVEWVPPPTSSPARCMGWIPIRVREESPTARTLLYHSQGFQRLLAFWLLQLHTYQNRGDALLRVLSADSFLFVMVSSWVKSQQTALQVRLFPDPKPQLLRALMLERVPFCFFVDWRPGLGHIFPNSIHPLLGQAPKCFLMSLLGTYSGSIYTRGFWCPKRLELISAVVPACITA